MKAMFSPSPSFRARTVQGAGRGRMIRSPTLNLSLPEVPRELRHGIYACYATWNHRKRPAAMHYGPRPAFRAGVACEIHVIDHAIRRTPKTVAVTVVRRLRNIRNFKTPEALRYQISLDITKARAILKHT